MPPSSGNYIQAVQASGAGCSQLEFMLGGREPARTLKRQCMTAVAVNCKRNSERAHLFTGGDCPLVPGSDSTSVSKLEFSPTSIFSQSAERLHKRRPISSRKELEQTSSAVFACLNHTFSSQKAFGRLEKVQMHPRKQKLSKRENSLFINFEIPRCEPPNKHLIYCMGTWRDRGRTIFSLTAPLLFTLFTTLFPNMHLLLRFILWLGYF